MKLSKPLIILIVVGLPIGWFALDVGQWLTLANVKAEQSHLNVLIQQSPWLARAIFFVLIY